MLAQEASPVDQVGGLAKRQDFNTIAFSTRAPRLRIWQCDRRSPACRSLKGVGCSYWGGRNGGEKFFPLLSDIGWESWAQRRRTRSILNDSGVTEPHKPHFNHTKGYFCTAARVDGGSRRGEQHQDWNLMKSGTSRDLTPYPRHRGDMEPKNARVSEIHCTSVASVLSARTPTGMQSRDGYVSSIVFRSWRLIYDKNKFILRSCRHQVSDAQTRHAHTTDLETNPAFTKA